MTQEELDALMGGDVDLDALEEETVEAEDSPKPVEDELPDSPDQLDESIPDDIAAKKWGPPATDENKVVHQLDDVTKESEEKASEIFDIIEGISNDLMEKEELLLSVVEVLTSNVSMFQTLSEKFPDVAAFKTQLAQNETAQESAQQVVEMLQVSGDSIMNVMDIMQYQDIHRQKIERVINVMRALSKYMNSLFDSKVDDSQRVSSAKHIVGDATSDVASTEDIEALLEQFGK
ncbi:MAG: chemotaxis protein [Epsilonproteobacteria bacterium]|nr:chemotaxis protein [Campylobacterota bacterium]